MAWVVFLICAFLGIGLNARRLTEGARHLVLLLLIAATLTLVYAGFQAVP
jgi:hypothetical protein